MAAFSEGDMTNAYPPICRAFIAPDIGRRPCQLPNGDASRQAHAAVEAQCEFLKPKDVAIARSPSRK